MSSPLDSNNWYRVCDLKPRLRNYVRVHRHRYRDRKWFVLSNPASGRNHRIDQMSYELIALMNGQRTLDQVWLLLNEKTGGQAPTQDQVISLLGKLHNADILHLDNISDTNELFSRHEDHKKSRIKQALRSPFFLKLPLLDPEKLLNRWSACTPLLFNRVSLVLLTVLLIFGGAMAAMHWPALISDARSNLLSPLNLLVLWMVFPIVKTLHELGHALAVKHWGGEIHDTGVMFLVFMPVPYVDASTANAFENKWARIVVAAAGILVELGLAAIAMLVWLAVEPGLVRTIALDVMTIGGISTLLFNGNPLLKFDGYYVLSDLIEIPNLSTRSSQYYGYLFKRYALGLHQTRRPVLGAGERN